MIREQNDDLQSQTINWLRFPLAVAVVFVHSFGISSEYTLPSLNISFFSGMDFFNLTRVFFSCNYSCRCTYFLFDIGEICFLD